MGNEKLQRCLRNYYVYHHRILVPALQELENLIPSNKIKLYHAIGINMLIAQALEYLRAVEEQRRPDSKIKIQDITEKLDRIYNVQGAIFKNKKFLLINATNNSIKHVKLDPNRKPNEEAIAEYGNISFRFLSEKAGIIYFTAEKYKFDYGRIVLRSVSKIFNFAYETPDMILDLLDGALDEGSIDESYFDPFDPSTAIERMIDECNPVCLDCGEVEHKCNCNTFLYGDRVGEFNPVFDEDFDFDATMSQISGSYEE